MGASTECTTYGLGLAQANNKNHAPQNGRTNKPEESKPTGERNKRKTNDSRPRTSRIQRKLTTRPQQFVAVTSEPSSWPVGRQVKSTRKAYSRTPATHVANTHHTHARTHAHTRTRCAPRVTHKRTARHQTRCLRRSREPD